MVAIPYAVAYIATMFMIASTVYSVASSFQRKSELASKRQAAIQDYYRQLQRGQTQSRVFTASQRSVKDVRAMADRYTSISQQLVEEASAREKFSRSEGKYRDVLARQRSFGNKYSANREIFQPTPDDKPETILLARSDFGQTPDVFQTKFNIEIFNYNFIEEA